MPRRKSSQHHLSPLELDIMNVVWELGECTSAEVIEAFQKKRPLANTTIRTVMSNIRKKGYIEMVPSVESRIHFRAKVPKQAVARSIVRQMLSNLFDDSPREAIAFLLEGESLEPGELEEIRRLIDEYEDARESS
jgi:BlaI family penicillinase repressor